MTLKDDIKEIKKKCGDMAVGNGSCWICGCQTAKRGMTVHHRWYLQKDVIYKDYPRNDSGVLQYYKDLYQMVQRNPNRFMYLCNTHHQALERICRYSDKIFNKLCIARKMTKT